MKTVAILFISFCSVFQVLASYDGFSRHQEYSKCEYVDSDENVIPYRMLVPDSLKDGCKYPLVLFLHGAGERGDDNEKQLLHGASIFSNPVNTARYPAFVIFPQCKERSWTGTVDERVFMPGASVPPESREEEMVMKLLEDVIDNNPVDTDRIYIVGISMGGIAAYDLVCRYPDIFAAAVPICGAVNPERLPAAKNVKFMIFHGEMDEEIPVICGREAYKALNSVGAEVDYIEFSGVGHDCWTSTFNCPSLLPWLFSQRKNLPGSEVSGSLTSIDD